MKRTIEKLNELGIYVDNDGIASYTEYISDIPRDITVKVDLNKTYLLCAGNVIGDMIEEAYSMGRKSIQGECDPLETTVSMATIRLHNSLKEFVTKIPLEDYIDVVNNILPAIHSMTEAIEQITGGY